MTKRHVKIILMARKRSPRIVIYVFNRYKAIQSRNPRALMHTERPLAPSHIPKWTLVNPK